MSDKATTITDDQAYDIQMGCYRMEALLKVADRMIEDLPILEKETDRKNAEDAKLIVESARVLLWQITGIIENVVNIANPGETEKPADL